MKFAITPQLKKAAASFEALSPRERVIVGSTAAFIVCAVLILMVSRVSAFLAEREQVVASRLQTLEDLEGIASRYSELKSQFDELKSQFDEAHMTFEDVATSLDSIVKKELGPKGTYDLRKGDGPEEFLDAYERQEYEVALPSLTMDQLLSLLMRLDEGEDPLFLSGLQIEKTREGEFSAHLTLSLIRPKTTNAS